MSEIDLDGYKPSADEEFMNDRQRAYFRKKLEDWKQDILDGAKATIGNLQEDSTSLPDIVDRASAESDKALELKEASYPAVIYIPRSDISIEHYARSEHRTHCPYKGDASYFSLNANGEVAENAVWTYEQAYPSVKEIEGHVAFYPDKVTLEVH